MIASNFLCNSGRSNGKTPTRYVCMWSILSLRSLPDKGLKRFELWMICESRLLYISVFSSSSHLIIYAAFNHFTVGSITYYGRSFYHIDMRLLIQSGLGIESKFNQMNFATKLLLSQCETNVIHFSSVMLNKRKTSSKIMTEMTSCGERTVRHAP